jgi:transmembrane sensor
LSKPESAFSIDNEAARWAARAAHGEMTAESRAELDAWLAADRRHRGAFLRAQAGLIALEDAIVQSRREPVPINDNTPWEDTAPRARRRAGVLFGAALAAAMAGAALVGAWQLPIAGGDADPAQPTTLADGSTVTLGEGARIAARFEDGKRTVVVQSGEATFEVAHDPERPFVVHSGDVYAQAMGTIYSVRKVGAAGAAVAVKEGTVLVWAEGKQDRAVPLHAGEALTLNPASVAPAAQLVPPGGRISLDNVSIAAAAERFNAVNRIKIIVADPQIGQTPIVGLFDADDPEGFATAAAAVTGARVVRRDGRIVIEM